MALKESFETYDGTGFSAYGTRWKFQTFTTTSAYNVTDIALYGWRFGNCGTVTISIREVDGDGKPTGADLASGTIAQGSISALPSITWVTCTFGASYALSDATEYAIVWRAPSGDASNYYAPFGYGSSGYAGGGSGTSTDSGVGWSAVSSTNDTNFRVYGDNPLPGKPTTPSPTNAGTDITLDETPLSWVSGGNTDTYEIYWRIQGDAWVLVGAAQAGLTWTIDFGTIDYGVIYEWRIDATNVNGTTTGDTWYFTALSFTQIQISYRLIGGGGGSGPYDDPPGTEGTDWSFTGDNTMLTIRKLVAAANNKIWYEDI